MEKKDEEKIKNIGNKYNHSFCKRSETKIELVRMMGDQLDSRIVIQNDSEDGLIAEYTFWIEGNGNVEHDETYDKFNDCDFWEDLEDFAKRGNKRFKIECIKRDEEPKEW